jgi:hypothetical protein
MTVIPPGPTASTRRCSPADDEVLDIGQHAGYHDDEEGRPLAAGELRPACGPGTTPSRTRAFVDAGGGRVAGAVILAGRYFINPRFATVEIKDTTIVPLPMSVW